MKEQKLSFWLLLLTNLIFGVYYIQTNNNIGFLLWVYWFQSVSIGLVNYLRILTQKNFSVTGVFINGRPLDKTEKSKNSTAKFFVLHYGGFHFMYALVLMKMVPVDLNKVIVVGAIIFGVNHLVSFLLRYNKESLINKNIGHLALYPYIRIIPVHLIILFNGDIIGSGQNFFWTSFIFVLMKTITDCVMHIIEQKYLLKI